MQAARASRGHGLVRLFSTERRTSRRSLVASLRRSRPPSATLLPIGCELLRAVGLECLFDAIERVGSLFSTRERPALVDRANARTLWSKMCRLARGCPSCFRGCFARRGGFPGRRFAAGRFPSGRFPSWRFASSRFSSNAFPRRRHWTLALEVESRTLVAARFAYSTPWRTAALNSTSARTRAQFARRQPFGVIQSSTAEGGGSSKEPPALPSPLHCEELPCARTARLAQAVRNREARWPER